MRKFWKRNNHLVQLTATIELQKARPGTMMRLGRVLFVGQSRHSVEYSLRLNSSRLDTWTAARMQLLEALQVIDGGNASR